jgi:hypothetical protein
MTKAQTPSRAAQDKHRPSDGHATPAAAQPLPGRRDDRPTAFHVTKVDYSKSRVELVTTAQQVLMARANTRRVAQESLRGGEGLGGTVAQAIFSNQLKSHYQPQLRKMYNDLVFNFGEREASMIWLSIVPKRPPSRPTGSQNPEQDELFWITYQLVRAENPTLTANKAQSRAAERLRALGIGQSKDAIRMRLVRLASSRRGGKPSRKD